MNKNRGPISITLPVLWGDMDAFGHVNNTRYFRWFESARIDYFKALDDALVTGQNGTSLILAKTSCDYLMPVNYPDHVTIDASITKIGRTSCVQEYLVYSDSHQDKLIAKGQGVIVLYDYINEKSVAITDELRKAICILEKKDLA